MKIFVQVVISFLLAWWPIVALTSVMMFGGPGSTNDAKNLKFAILLILYPAVFGVGLYLFNFSLWGIPPKWTLITTLIAPILAILLFGYPKMLINAKAGIPNDRYFKSESQVYYYGNKMKADPATFEIIEETNADPLARTNNLYAKDKNQVFLKGKPIPSADPKTFHLIGSGWRYAKDARHVFFEGKVIAGVDHTRFAKVQPVVENDQSYTDGNSLVYWGAVVGKVDGATVQSIGPSYVKDRTQVFYLGKQILGADPVTFAVINAGPFSRDKSQVYHGTTVLPQARPETFQVLERSYAKDDQHVFYVESENQVKIIEGADPQGFKVTQFDSKRGSDAFDGKNYFLNGKLLH